MTDADGETGRPAGRVLWLVLLLLPVVEVVGHGVIRARVPSDADWRRAAAHVNEHHAEGDALTVAPGWADPLLRRFLGDRMSLSEAGRSDLAPYERLWALTIRGRRPAHAPRRAPDFVEHFGRVRVLRWDLGPSPVRFDFVRHLKAAEVSRLDGSGQTHPCPWQRGRPRGGGLGKGPAVPRARFVCDPRRSWLWVGRTVIEDMAVEPRHCIWQHPQGRQPIRTAYEDVPLGDRIVLYAGLYWVHERVLGRSPVHVLVRIDGEPAGRMIHRDGDGWKRMSVSTRGFGPTGTVRVEVTAPNPHLRSLCWAATAREGRR